MYVDALPADNVQERPARKLSSVRAVAEMSPGNTGTLRRNFMVCEFDTVLTCNERK